ncbi:hypothetical protein GGI11_000106 [Coemansia sp. RSA 2049]|nr:hypothetical protein GGI11_000106 [Coemansia sp. RSA 2049]
MRNGQQTFCGVIPFTQEHAFVAANCFGPGATESDIASGYQVMLSGPGYGTPAPIGITAAAVNEHYDNNTFANNIAILTLDNAGGQQTTTFEAEIGDLPSEWPYYYFVQHSLTESLGQWNSIGTAGSSPTVNFNPCTESSSLFDANRGALICSTLLRRSFIHLECNTPYKYVVGSDSLNNSAIIALYSYSSIPSTAVAGFCSNDGGIMNFYTNLMNYIPWAERVANRSIQRFHTSTASNNNNSKETSDADYSMAMPGPKAANNGARVYGFYGIDQSVLGLDNLNDRKSTGVENTPAGQADESGGNAACGIASTVTVTGDQTAPSNGAGYGTAADGSVYLSETTDPLGNIKTYTFTRDSQPTNPAGTGDNNNNDDGGSNCSVATTTVYVDMAATTATDNMYGTPDYEDAGDASNGSGKRTGGLSRGAVIAIVVVTVSAAGLAGLGYYVLRRRRKQKAQRELDQADSIGPALEQAQIQIQAPQQPYHTRYNFTSYIFE